MIEATLCHFQYFSRFVQVTLKSIHKKAKKGIHKKLHYLYQRIERSPQKVLSTHIKPTEEKVNIFARLTGFTYNTI